MKKIIFPANCNTESSRWSFCMRLEQKLLDNQKIQSDLYASGDITLQAYRDYEDNIFLPNLNAITNEIGLAKIEARNGVDRDGNQTPWTPDIGRDIV